MKGTISPLLRKIMSNRDDYKKFLSAWDSYKRGGPNRVELSTGEVVFHKNKRVKPKRSLIQILLGL